MIYMCYWYDNYCDVRKPLPPLLHDVQASMWGQLNFNLTFVTIDLFSSECSARSACT